MVELKNSKIFNSIYSVSSVGDLSSVCVFMKSKLVIKYISLFLRTSQQLSIPDWNNLPLIPFDNIDNYVYNMALKYFDQSPYELLLATS